MGGGEDCPPQSSQEKKSLLCLWWGRRCWWSKWGHLRCVSPETLCSRLPLPRSRWRWRGCEQSFFFKSMTASLVLCTLRDGLFSLQRTASPASFPMWFKLCVAVQSRVSSVNSNGLKTHPWGAPALMSLPIRTNWGLYSGKSRIQLPWKVSPDLMSCSVRQQYDPFYVLLPITTHCYSVDSPHPRKNVPLFWEKITSASIFLQGCKLHSHEQSSLGFFKRS